LVAPLGPLRVQQGQAGATADALIDGLNNGTVTLSPPLGPGSGTGSYPNVTGTTVTVSGGGTTTTTTTTTIGAGPLGRLLGPVPAWLQPWAWPLSILVVLVALGLDLILILAGFAGGWIPLAVALAVVIFIVAILFIWWLLGPSTTTTTTTTTSTTVSTLTGYGPPLLNPSGATILAAALTVPNMPAFSVVSVGNTPAAATITSAPDSGDAANLRSGLQATLTTVNGVVAPPAAATAIDLPALGGSIVGALEPKGTVEKRAVSFVNIDPRLNWAPADPIEPIMAAPDFPQPMYAPLCQLSQEYLLPGVGQIPRESVGLLEPNMAFIESYMVGLNFEMGRQLLWNGYPTDQRGSYFRQFWDVSGYVPGPGDPPLGSAALAEELKDIAPIHTWNPNSDIGTHPNPASPAAGTVLVLLIRGELLRRYPTTHVYAVPGLMQTQPDGSIKRIPNPDPSQELHPLFSGTMAPDLSYFGFPLSPTQAHSGPDYPGYYFVLQQHPTQPRFGLETDGSPGSWQCFPSGFATVAAQNAPAGSPPLPSLPTGWGSDAATMASITFRNPVQVSIHADLMLPG
jgi:hypothetical protein